MKGNKMSYGDSLGKENKHIVYDHGVGDVVVVAVGNDDASLWHNKLGHVSQKGMKELLSKGKLSELKNVQFDMCESCIMGKQKKFSFLTGGKKLRAIKLDLVHTDL